MSNITGETSAHCRPSRHWASRSRKSGRPRHIRPEGGRATKSSSCAATPIEPPPRWSDRPRSCGPCTPGPKANKGRRRGGCSRFAHRIAITTATGLDLLPPESAERSAGPSTTTPLGPKRRCCGLHGTCSARRTGHLAQTAAARLCERCETGSPRRFGPKRIWYDEKE